MFDVIDSDNDAYLEFSKVNVRWQAGLASDQEYLEALATYANTFEEGTSEYLNAQERVREATYTIARNRVVAEIEAGTKSYEDLLAFDAAELAKVPASDNQFYRQLAANLAASTNRAAYEDFNQVRERWQAGKVNDAAYLTAFENYVEAIPNEDEQQLVQFQLDAARYSLARNALVTRIEQGKAAPADLLAFDQAAIASGVVKGSQEYRDRLGRLQQTQTAVFADQENVVQLQHSQGRMTTAQLVRWYEEARDGTLAAGNAPLQERITGQIDSLSLRLLDERDSKMVDDFNEGKISVSAFVAYAKDARGRYDRGTPQYQQWDDRIAAAGKRSLEDNLLYRYGLTSEYADLRRFIQTHRKAPWEGGAASEETRWVLQPDGTWKPVVTKKSQAYDPTPDQLEAWAEVQAEVAEARNRLRYIEGQISGVPGGWVNHRDLLDYYTGIQGDYVVGSTEWYSIQQRIDQVREEIGKENVYKTVGVSVSYPWTPRDAGPRPGGGGGGGGGGGQQIGQGVTVDAFMRSLAASESNGSYTARHPKSGAYGKYQHLPQYWAQRAAQYLGNGQAPMTPANQEAVTRGMVADYYKRYGDWRLVALAWRNGPGWVSENVGRNSDGSWNIRPESWRGAGFEYVDRIMSRLGGNAYTPATTHGTFTPEEGWNFPRTPTGGGGGGGNQPAIPRPTGGQGTGGGSGTNAPPQSGGRPTDSSGPTVLREFTGGTTVMGQPYTSFPGSEKIGTTRPTTRATGLPAWATDNNLSGTNFEDFYGDFVNAYRNNETSVTFWREGKAIVYSIPEDPAERQAMMIALDDIRINLHGNRAAAYWQVGDTDNAREADNKFEGAVKDKGENMIIGLIQPGRERSGPNVNPIADARAVLETNRTYIDFQKERAQEALDRGDTTAAWAHLMRAQRRADDTTRQMGELQALATVAVAGIQTQTGTPVPGSVTDDIDWLNSWDKDLDLDDLEKMHTELAGTPDGVKQGLINGQWRNGVFVPQFDPLTFETTLRPGIVRTLDAKGNVTYDELPPQRTDRNGNPLPGQAPSPLVATTMRINNSVVTVHLPTKTDVVGRMVMADGREVPLYGRAVYNSRTGEWAYENPLAPGHWSMSPVDYHLPENARLVSNPNYPSDMTQTRVVFHNEGRWWSASLAPDGSGTYVFTQTDGAGNPIGNPQPFRTDAQNFDVEGFLGRAGFQRDVTSLSPEERYFADTSGAIFGMSRREHERFIKPPLPFKTAAWTGEERFAAPAVSLGKTTSLIGRSTVQDAVRAITTGQQLTSQQRGLLGLKQPWGQGEERFARPAPVALRTTPVYGRDVYTSIPGFSVPKVKPPAAIKTPVMQPWGQGEERFAKPVAAVTPKATGKATPKVIPPPVKPFQVA